MKLKPLTFALAAGGTGGHMFPADALCKELQRRGHKVILITDSRGQKFTNLFKGVESHLIESGTFARNGIIGKIKTLVALTRGFVKASWLLIKISPTGVVGFGGYPVVPTMTAARFLSIPYCLHEQNAVLGRANRAIAGGAKAIAISFKKTKKLKKRFLTKTYITGNPVRQEIVDLGTKPYPGIGADNVIRLLVMGGSQGATIFADVVPEALGMLPKAVRDRLQVTQQCRADDLERVEAAYKSHNIAAEVFSFIEDVPARLLWAHLVIGRAGATTLFELTAAGRPAILVPLPSALDDHQSVNAEVLVYAGAAWVIAEKDFTSPELAKLMQKLMLQQKPLKKAAEAALGLGYPEATQRLADLVEEMVFKGYAKARDKEQENNSSHTDPTEFRRVAA